LRSFTPRKGLTEKRWLNVSLPLCAICGKDFSYDTGKGEIQSTQVNLYF
jgi:hypothetical protein